MRLAVGDTDVNVPGLQDEEVDMLLADNGLDVLLSAIDAARRLSAKYGSMIDETQAGLNAAWGLLQEKYRAIEAMLREEMVRKGRNGFVVGGLTVADKSTALLDLDRVQPAFWRRQPRRAVVYDLVGWPGVW